MESTAHGWTVIDRGAGVLVYDYAFTGEGRANAFAARLPDGTMMVLSPGCRMPEGAFADLAEFGEVGALVATNGFHHLGQSEWRRRFPEARAFASPEAAERIKKKNPEAGEFEPMSALQPLLGDRIGVREAPATKCGETWAWVETEQGPATFVSDLLVNLPRLPSSLIPSLIFRLSGSAPGFRVFHMATFFILKDKKRVLRGLLEDLEAHPPRVIVPAHGELLSGEGLLERSRAVLEKAL